MRIVSTNEMYQIDKYTVEQIGISEETLMESAGQAVARKILEEINPNKKITILTGVGNNGGDGFVIARILKSKGFNIDLWVIPPLGKIKGAAKHALEVFKRAGFDVHQFLINEERFYSSLSTYDVIIDCLLGIGMKDSLRSPYKEVIERVNSCKSAFIIAIDVPSGIPADAANVTQAIRADMTITIQSPKLGAFMYPSASYYGELDVVDIGIPPIAINYCSQQRLLWTENLVKKHLPKRVPSSHKGSNGKGLIIGGSRQMSGAVMLSAKASLRSGAGLLTVAIPEEIHPIVSSHFLEAMYLPCSSENGHFKEEITFEPEKFNAIAIGPGMGRTTGAKQIVEDVLTMDVPLILDADALYHLQTMLPLLKKRQKPTILTPHPGEMARLIGKTIKEVEQDRFIISEQFAKEYNVYLVLKGPFTIVTTPNGEQYVNSTGNAALAKGGTGDVLTGMILAFFMQQNDIQVAISNAVFVHGKSADLLVEEKHTPVDVLATDIIENIPRTLKVINN